MRDWRQQAACRGHDDPDLWFAHPTEYARRRSALVICRACPVAVECDQFAEDNDIRDGIWGGLDRREVRRMRYLAQRRATRAARITRQQTEERPAT
ncbi:WhiB family transcriptional regulator [Streptomyces sp. NPDC026673]|uniref:WhiB family transcriptional regulator n=1 Tax=Streptomyces sp. NPDC026673 TaxID=3155724 RepID=UPI0033D01F29